MAEEHVVRLTHNRMTILTAVLVYALMSYSITSNMLTPLLPNLEKAYNISPVAAIWITLISLLSGAAFVPTLCRLGDSLGWKKSVALGGLCCLAVGGVIAALSSSMPSLLVGRALQGVSLVVFPMVAGIVNDEFTVIRRKVAISLLSGGLFFGTGAGGVIAGLLVEGAGDFRLVFWMSVVLPLIAIPLLAVFAPRGRGPAPSAPPKLRNALDLAGAVGFAVPAIALDIAFSQGSTWGWSSARNIALYVIAGVVAVAWVFVERRKRYPMVDQTVFWSRPIWVNNAVSILAGFGIFGAAVATGAFVQMPPLPGIGGLGSSPVVAALIVLPAEWMMLVIGPLVGYFSHRVGKGMFLFGGAIVEGLGFVLILAFHGSLAQVGFCMGVIGIGIGCVAASFGLIYVEDIPPEHVGRLFGISPILANGVGGSIAGAVFGAILTANHLPGSEVPSFAAFRTFWLIAATACLAAACFAAVYLVTYWGGLRGGDRALVRPNVVEAPTGPAAVTVRPD